MRRVTRALTAGEIRMAALLFGAAIDPARVRVHNRRYLPLVQPKNCAMTPNGSIYFHHTRFLPDYAAGDPHTIHWFVHELAHVWQHQLGYPVRLRGALRDGAAFKEEHDDGVPLPVLGAALGGIGGLGGLVALFRRYARNKRLAGPRGRLAGSDGADRKSASTASYNSTIPE
jgi:hypothetical protein